MSTNNTRVIIEMQCWVGNMRSASFGTEVRVPEKGWAALELKTRYL